MSNTPLAKCSDCPATIKTDHGRKRCGPCKDRHDADKKRERNRKK